MSRFEHPFAIQERDVSVSFGMLTMFRWRRLSTLSVSQMGSILRSVSEEQPERSSFSSMSHWAMPASALPSRLVQRARIITFKYLQYVPKASIEVPFTDFPQSDRVISSSSLQPLAMATMASVLVWLQPMRLRVFSFSSLDKCFRRLEFKRKHPEKSTFSKFFRFSATAGIPINK